jgi:transcriptional regulator with XRE-family HTH domain
MEAVFDSWDSKPPVLPARSRLYALKPVGIGTPFVESLSGYVTRLADAHAVSVGDLIGRELSPSAWKPLIRFGPLTRQRQADSHGFHAQANAINGFGESSQKWIDALETATLQRGLRFLTLSPFDGVFSHQGVFRAKRAWCPSCYEEWRVNGAVIYDPLLWSMHLVTLCPRHLTPMAGQCRHCRHGSQPLAVYSRPGYCSHCQRWLGEALVPPPDSSSDALPDRAVSRATAIGELFAAAPRLHGLSLHNVLTENLRACVNAVTGGNVEAFALKCHVARSVVHFYLRQSSLPTIEIVLRICCELKVPITAFLENDPNRAELHWKHARPVVEPRAAFRQPEQVRLVLLRALDEESTPSLSEIAQRLGYKGTDRLYQVDSETCKQIAAKYRKSGRSHQWRKPGADRISERVDIRSLLEQSLDQNQPVSAHRIAASLGYANEGYVRQKFPDLCCAIGKKLAAQRTKRLSKIERVLTEALVEYPIPTLQDLRKRVGYSSSSCLQLHFPELCQEILARRRSAQQGKIAKLKSTLESLLSEVPAVSLTIVSQRTGLSRGYLQQLCPEQCAALGARYRTWRHDAHERREMELFAEVRDVVRTLHNEGRCPSINKVTSRLSPSALKDWKTHRRSRQSRASSHRESPMMRAR